MFCPLIPCSGEKIAFTLIPSFIKESSSGVPFFRREVWLIIRPTFLFFSKLRFSLIKISAPNKISEFLTGCWHLQAALKQKQIKNILNDFIRLLDDKRITAGIWKGILILIFVII